MPASRGTPINFLEGPGDYTTTRTVHTDTYDAISPSKMELSGRAVFVTGASKGVGKEVAHAYARTGASYIAVGARSSLSSTTTDLKQAARDAGTAEPKVLTLKLRVMATTSVQAAADQIEQEIGRLNTIVNNADSWTELGTITKSTPMSGRGSWRSTADDSLKTLVTIGSLVGIITIPGGSENAMSNPAVLRFMELVAAEYGDLGVIAYTVHPRNNKPGLACEAGRVTPEVEPLFRDSLSLPADIIAFLTAKRRGWLNGLYVSDMWDLPELFARKDEIVSADKLKVKSNPPSPV